VDALDESPRRILDDRPTAQGELFAKGGSRQPQLDHLVVGFGIEIQVKDVLVRWHQICREKLLDYSTDLVSVCKAVFGHLGCQLGQLNIIDVFMNVLNSRQGAFVQKT
jgi:hypothetical protein